MNRQETFSLDLPPSPAALPLFGATLRAMLMRVQGLKNPVEFGNGLVTITEEMLAPHFHRLRPEAGVRIPASLTITHHPRFLRIVVGDMWQHEVKLPDLVDPSAPEPKIHGSGLGMGLFLVRQLTDEVEYRPMAGGNRWRLSKRLPAGISTEAEQVTLDLPAGHKYLNTLGELVATFLKPLDLPADSTFVHDTQLAIHETCTNIVEHSYTDVHGRMKITLALDPAAGLFTAQTYDIGLRTFDLAAVPDPFELAPTPRGGLVSGGTLLFISTTIVNAGNYLFNLVLGRWLGPSQFADLSLMVTLLLMVSFVVVGVQQTAARFAAMFSAGGETVRLAALRLWMRRWALIAGLALMAILGLGAPLWQRFFHTTSFWPFVILAAALPLYLIQSVDRGVLQGQMRFKLLSGSYQAEMWVRLLGAVALVAVGWAVNGAVGAISLSLVAAWLVGARAGRDLPEDGAKLAAEDRRAVLLFAGPVVVSEISQILINNSDILIVKHFFPAEAAGHYAALALIGRMVFYATWSVVVVMFPIVAQRQERGESHRILLAVSLGLVSIVSVIIIAASLLFPELIVNILFGEAYLVVAPLLWLYAIATAFYALANVVVNYRLSLGNGAGASFALVAGVVQVLGLWFFHDSLRQIVLVQIGIMAVLLTALLFWDLTQQRTERR